MKLFCRLTVQHTRICMHIYYMLEVMCQHKVRRHTHNSVTACNFHMWKLTPSGSYLMHYTLGTHIHFAQAPVQQQQQQREKRTNELLQRRHNEHTGNSDARTRNTHTERRTETENGNACILVVRGFCGSRHSPPPQQTNTDTHTHTHTPNLTKHVYANF